MPEAFYLKKLQYIIQEVLQKHAHVWIFMLILHEDLGFVPKLRDGIWSFKFRVSDLNLEKNYHVSSDLIDNHLSLIHFISGGINQFIII